MIVIATVSLGSMLLQSAVNQVTRGHPFPAEIGTAVVASKVINDVPAAFDAFCLAETTEKICQLRTKIDARRALGIDKDDQFLWNAELMPWKGPPEETLSLEEFNAAGASLGTFVVLNYPFDFLLSSARDYVRMFADGRCFVSGPGYIQNTPDSERTFGYLNTKDAGTLARRGYFDRTPWCAALNQIKIGLFILGTLAAVHGLLRHSGLLRQQVLVLVTALYANDAAFAITSAASARYQGRTLLLSAVILMLVLNRWHEQGKPVPGRVAGHLERFRKRRTPSDAHGVRAGRVEEDSTAGASAGNQAR
jgi:hypothetical protein